MARHNNFRQLAELQERTRRQQELREINRINSQNPVRWATWRDSNEPRIPEPTNTLTINQRLNTTSQRLEEFLLEMEQRSFITIGHPHIVFRTSGLENQEFEEESWVREDNFIVKENSHSFYCIFDIEHKFFKISSKTLQEELESVYTSFNLNVDYLG